MIHFSSLDGVKVIATYHRALQRLQGEIEESLGSKADGGQALIEMSENSRILVRLIVNQVHDTLTLTMTLLNAIIVHSKEYKAYFLASVAEDSDPVLFTSLHHFFANHYNQLMTILAEWDKEDNDFGKLLENDSKLSYMGNDTILITLLKEAASGFINCPMLKENFVDQYSRGYLGQGRGALGGYNAGGGLFGAPNRNN